MAELQSLIPGDEEPDGDAMLLTQLANGLVSRIPTLCTLKTFYDGKEQVPVKSIPKSTNQSGYAVYQRFISICQLDLAKAIADAGDTPSEAHRFQAYRGQDDAFHEGGRHVAQCRMELKSRQMFHDLAVYGNAYALVNKNKLPSHITVLSPWNTYVSSDEDSAVNYWYKASEGREYLALYRLIRNDDGSVKDVYCHIAYNETDSRSLLDEGDEEEIYGIANDDSSFAQPCHPRSSGMAVRKAPTISRRNANAFPSCACTRRAARASSSRISPRWAASTSSGSSVSAFRNCRRSNSVRCR